MPSDLVWVAIISSGVATGGAIASAAIAGLVTYHVTKRQTATQIETVTNELRHRTDEAIKERLVRAREENLLSLRVCLGRYFGGFTNVASNVRGFQQLVEGGLSPGDVAPQLILEAISESADVVLNEGQEAEFLRSQLSDKTLINMVTTFIEGIRTASSGLNFEQGGTIDALTDIALRIESALQVARPALVSINGRIEQLLTAKD